MVQVVEQRLRAGAAIALAPGVVRPLACAGWRAGLDAGAARVELIVLGPHRYESAPTAPGQRPALLIVAVGSGRLRGTAGEHPFIALTGQVLVVDAQVPIVAHVDEEVRLLRLLVGRDRLPGDLAGEARTAVLSASPVVQSCVAAATTLLRLCRSGGEADAESVAHTLTGLAAGLLAEARQQRLDRSAADGPEQRRAAIDQHVRARLADPALSPASIAAAFGLSLRSVHAAFAGSGTTVAALIRRRRIEAVQRELGSRVMLPRLAELAATHGFTGPEQLSRSFRAVTGEGLRDWFEREGR